MSPVCAVVAGPAPNALLTSLACGSPAHPRTSMSLSLVSNAYLDENSTKIRSKPVPWEASLRRLFSLFVVSSSGTQGYMRANLVKAEDLAMIRKVDRQPRQKVESLLLSNGPQYASLYLRLLKNLNRVDTMQYILVLIGDALTGADSAAVCSTRDGLLASRS